MSQKQQPGPAAFLLTFLEKSGVSGSCAAINGGPFGTGGLCKALVDPYLVRYFLLPFLNYIQYFVRFSADNSSVYFKSPQSGLASSHTWVDFAESTCTGRVLAMDALSWYRMFLGDIHIEEQHHIRDRVV